MFAKGTIGLKVVINAPDSVVFKHLTDPGLLCRWFCDEAEIEQRVGGGFVFGGPHSFMSTFIEKAGIAVIEEYNPPALFKFSFSLNGSPTSMEFQLTAEQDRTSLLLTHRDIPRESLMMDALIVSLSNLVHLVETGMAGHRLNYLTDITDEKIEREIKIESSPEAVFKALIDKNSLSLWFTDTIREVDPQIGGVYDVGWRSSDGKQIGPIKITQLEDNRRLGYSWFYDPDGGSQAVWELTPDENGTRVRLTHEGFKRGRYNKDYYQGWHAYMLALKGFVEKGCRPFEVVEGNWEF
ncbi:MAG TPA: hypothetical protein ENO22_07960 [candidate division Zixibacteria bacterium]|nr:hypothetical protein [candidate division Zixibacteria bacterium]HEQ99258.1 hypothetical protein [candidate division Zixibacteria bacterium]